MQPDLRPLPRQRRQRTRSEMVRLASQLGFSIAGGLLLLAGLLAASHRPDDPTGFVVTAAVLVFVSLLLAFASLP